MPRRVDASILDAEVVTFEAEVRRLALAIVEQAFAAELDRWRHALATMDPFALPAAPSRRRRRR